MTDVTLIAILLVFFALAIGLVRVLGRMIEGDGDPEEFPDEPPGGDGPSAAGGPYDASRPEDQSGRFL
jgi:hypothetical protein